jgi:hypothetical protein
VRSAGTAHIPIRGYKQNSGHSCDWDAHPSEISRYCQCAAATEYAGSPECRAIGEIFENVEVAPHGAASSRNDEKQGGVV